MTITLPLLQQVQVASPCPARWEDMKGDEVTRHCAQCDLQVHNLSAMTEAEAQAFLQARLGKGRVCARFHRRQDGTILTQDCPVGLALWRRRAVGAAFRIAAAGLFLATGGWMLSPARRDAAAQRLRSVQPFRAVCEWFNPAAPPLPVTRVLAPVVMGDICVQPPPTPLPPSIPAGPAVPATPQGNAPPGVPLPGRHR
jgi:hypothetical protein